MQSFLASLNVVNSYLILFYCYIDNRIFSVLFVYMHWAYNEAVGVQPLLFQNAPLLLLFCFFFYIFYIYFYLILCIICFFTIASY